MNSSVPCYLLLVTTLLFHMYGSLAQMTQSDPDACTYSFVVPQNDLKSTCDSMSDQKVEQMQKTVKDLKDKVTKLTRQKNNNVTTSDPSYKCGCSNKTSMMFAYKDCEDVKKQIGGISGAYEITIIRDTGPMLKVKDPAANRTSYYLMTRDVKTVKVYCDMTSDDAGWLVIMRRTKFNVSFDRTWQEYKDGFGDIMGDFWLGLENMHLLTSSGTTYSLWIVIHDGNNVPHVLPYDSVLIGNENTNYGITVTGFHGKLQDRLIRYGVIDSTPFMTKDAIYHSGVEKPKGKYMYTYRNGIRTSGYVTPDYSGCANDTEPAAGGGGWWFQDYSYDYGTENLNCGYMNLNAPVPYSIDIKHPNITKVEMKILPHF